MRVESSGKPDAWKLARPVWGWGRGETPRPTPLAVMSGALKDAVQSEGLAVESPITGFPDFRAVGVQRAAEPAASCPRSCKR